MAVNNSKSNEIYNLFKDKKIGLALSGGGHRDAVFHLGVLSYLAANGLLESVKHLSTVSGGSVVMGLIYKLNDYKFPTSKEYKDKVFPQIVKYFTERSLQGRFTFNIFDNFDFINRHSALSSALKDNWDIDKCIQEIPDTPIWTINTTVAETGKSWRIQQNEMGEYKLGSIKNPKIDLSDAIAASAGFPFGVGPLKLDLSKYNFMPKGMKDQKSLLLYDGGLYDNLGLEVFVKKNFSNLSDTIDFLVASDASKPLKLKKVWYWQRANRLMDVSTEQIRSLKMRLFHKFLYDNKDSGLYIRMGKAHFGMDKEADIAESVGTNFKKISKNDFDSLQANGYTTAMAMFDKHYEDIKDV